MLGFIFVSVTSLPFRRKKEVEEVILLVTHGLLSAYFQFLFTKLLDVVFTGGAAGEVMLHYIYSLMLI